MTTSLADGAKGATCKLMIGKRAIIAIVGVTGQLDLAGSEHLAQRLHQLIDAGERRLIIEAQALDYISSAGLRVLLVAAKRLKALDGRIVLSSLKPHIKEVFEIGGLTAQHN